MSEPSTSENHTEEPAHPCSIDSVSLILKGHPKLILYYKQQGCVHCQKFEENLKIVGPSIPKEIEIAAVELGTEKECDELADRHDVKGTPTLAYYENGVLKEKFIPPGDVTEVRAKINALLQPKPLQMTPLPSSWEL